MHQYHLDWHMNEEKKRKERQQEGEIERLNQQLSNLIKKLSFKLDRQKYTKEEGVYNRQLVSCTIWQLGYRNNFINPKVLTLQAGWLFHILEEEKGLGIIENEDYLRREVSHLIHQIRIVDMSAYQELHQKHPKLRTIL